MPNWPEVPDWKFGDILTVDHPSGPADHRSARVMFVRWSYVADFNPTKSIFTGVVLEPGASWKDKRGDIITTYCGWWMPE